MRRHLVVLVAAAALMVPAPTATADHGSGDSGTGTTSRQACPDESQNPEGTPPNCGHQHPNDRDVDGVSDQDDNCPDAANASQEDRDGDGAGDACDGDRDGDGFDNDQDNCPDAYNNPPSDLDDDGVGDACDADRDGDGFDNEGDNCPDAYNDPQSDIDSDDVGDVCDADRDGDGVNNDEDNCPNVDNSGQEDSDGNGVGDACDSGLRVSGTGMCSGGFDAGEQATCVFVLTGPVVTLQGNASMDKAEPCNPACSAGEIEVTLWTMQGRLLGKCSAQQDVDYRLACGARLILPPDLPPGTPLVCGGRASGIGTFSCGSQSQM